MEGIKEEPADPAATGLNERSGYCAFMAMCLVSAGGRTLQLDYSLPKESKHSHLPVSFSWLCVGRCVGVRVGEVKKDFHCNDACTVERMFLMWIVHEMLMLNRRVSTKETSLVFILILFSSFCGTYQKTLLETRFYAIGLKMDGRTSNSY